MADTALHRFESFDGVEIAWHELGEGRPLVLIHGYFSNAWTNWIRYGHAAKIAAAGFRVIMPDLRAHGESAKPHDPAAYPPDVLMRGERPGLHEQLVDERRLAVIDVRDDRDVAEVSAMLRHGVGRR